MGGLRTFKPRCWVSVLGRPSPMATKGEARNVPYAPSPILGTRRLRSRCPRAAVPPEAPGEGPSRLFQLLGAPGVPGLVASSLPSLPLVFTGLLLCVCVSPLLCLGLSPSVFRRTLSLDVGPPSSRRTSSQTLPFITSAKTLFPNKVLFPATRD